MDTKLDPFNREQRRLIEEFMKPCNAPGEYWLNHLSFMLPPFTLLWLGLLGGHAWIVAVGGFALLGYLLYLLTKGLRYLRLLHEIVPTYEMLLDEGRARLADLENELAEPVPALPTVNAGSTPDEPEQLSAPRMSMRAWAIAKVTLGPLSTPPVAPAALVAAEIAPVAVATEPERVQDPAPVATPGFRHALAELGVFFRGMLRDRRGSPLKT